MVVTSQRDAQSAPPDDAESHRELCSALWFLISWRSNADIPLAEPEYASASNFGGWFDDSNLGGVGPSGQPHESIDLPSFYPPWPPAASMARPLANPPQDFYFGSTAAPLMDQGYNPPTFTLTSAHQQQHSQAPISFDFMGYTDPDSFTGLVQQDHLSSAAETTNDLSLIRTDGE